MGQGRANAETAAAFKLLGLRPGANEADIRRAWKALVRAYHPDRCGSDRATTNRRLAEINAAFDLVSAWRPQAGDAHGAARRQSAPHPPRRKTSPPPKASAGSDRTDRNCHRPSPNRALNRAQQPTPPHPSLAAAIRCFRDAQSVLDRKVPVRCLGFA